MSNNIRKIYIYIHTVFFPFAYTVLFCVSVSVWYRLLGLVLSVSMQPFVWKQLTLAARDNLRRHVRLNQTGKLQAGKTKRLFKSCIVFSFTQLIWAIVKFKIWIKNSGASETCFVTTVMFSWTCFVTSSFAGLFVDVFLATHGDSCFWHCDISISGTNDVEAHPAAQTCSRSAVQYYEQHMALYEWHTRQQDISSMASCAVPQWEHMTDWWPLLCVGSSGA